MSYPNPQYIDITLYTDDYDGLVQEVKDSQHLIEDADYTVLEDGDIIILRDQIAPQRNGNEAFMILRLPVGGGDKINTLQKVTKWTTVPVLGEAGEMRSANGAYGLTPARQAIIDAWPEFNYTIFAGS
jgi:hypothetical protein